MSRRSIQTFLLVVLVAGVAGRGIAQKPAKSIVIPMMALLTGDSGYRITGDGGPYTHQGTATDLNNLTIENDGHFIMVVRAITGRWVNLLFNAQCTSHEPNIEDCADPDFLLSADAVQTTYWSLRTYWKCRYISHADEAEPWTELIRSTTRKDATILNLKAMTPGETVGVSVEMMTFKVDGSDDLYGLTGQPLNPVDPGSAAYLLVTATDWDGDGAMDWILRSIPGKLVIKSYDRTDILPDGDCFRLTCGYPCEYGSFKLPVELKIAKLK